MAMRVVPVGQVPHFTPHGLVRKQAGAGVGVLKQRSPFSAISVSPLTFQRKVSIV
jgi:hypothetical protein